VCCVEYPVGSSAPGLISLLFWNVGRLSRHALIARLERANDADVIRLAEVADQPIDLLMELNKTHTNYFYSPGIGNTKILAFTRFSEQFFRPTAETDRLTIRKLTLPGLEEILLAVVHLLEHVRPGSAQARLARSIRLQGPGDPG